MSSRGGPITYGFADSTPVRTGQQRHRRGNTGNASGRGSSTVSSSSSQSYSISDPDDCHTPPQSQPASHYFTDAAWDNYTDNTPRKEDSGCNGSLTYSACSSVTSTESANISSFADIIKIIESEVDGEEGGDISRFIAKKTIPATDTAAVPSSLFGGGNNRGLGEKLNKETAVAGWMRHTDERISMRPPQEQPETKIQHEVYCTEPLIVKEQPKTMGKKQSLFTVTLSKRSMSSTPIAATKYMTQNSEDSDFNVEVELNDNILETIAGHDDDIKDSPHGRFVTPPPNTRLEIASIASSPSVISMTNSRSTASSPGTISSMTNSRHSKSYSGGTSSVSSVETPTPTSPTNAGASMMKPPSARTSPKSQRNSLGRGENNGEAIYSKPWMSGFADAFNFDGFDKDESFDFTRAKFPK